MDEQFRSTNIADYNCQLVNEVQAVFFSQNLYFLLTHESGYLLTPSRKAEGHHVMAFDPAQHMLRLMIFARAIRRGPILLPQP